MVCDCENDLNFKKGDIVAVLEKVNEDWWKGCIQGTNIVGIFPKVYTKEIVFFVEALWDLNGDGEDDLNFKKGDIVAVLEKVNEDWWKGCIQGTNIVGIFPKVYTKEIVFFVEALWDLNGDDEDDLNFKKGDIVEVHEKVNEDWWKGCIQGTNIVGIFPQVYTKEIYGKCEECSQYNTGKNWCNVCNANQFQRKFDKWTSGNREIDEFIRQMQHNAEKYGEVIEWIPFDRLENVEYLARGGFSIVYKAKWIDGYIISWDNNEKIWKRRSQNCYVCLKKLDDSINKSVFLQEIKNQLKFRGKWAIALYGITKDPSKNEYMMVMQYALEGSLRKMLDNKFKELSWHDKISILLHIAEGLSEMHKNHFVHKDFHSGNIVNDSLTKPYITDFGLCGQIFEKNPEKIYGVIPVLAPETLSKRKYTQESDMYSLGMIMLEVFTSYPPFYNIPHDISLFTSICNGLKPEIKCEVPQLLKDLMEKCWNVEPRVRPTAEELKTQLSKYLNHYDEDNDELKEQIEAANELNKDFIQYDPSKMHPEAIYTSRLFPKPTIPKYDTFTSRQFDFEIPNNIGNIFLE
ncbi:hypothetical protein Glove_114g10 [Diversispora epigaea]|uniref:mitogen-activated protein kinase kinase kinase n=1 Tax=Diversispora epigaea TaxID=1348612 RepID=A0A397J4Y2_9GLOM|nr:hypothetical protein Glove_114g10 [Diversispora epigaea]